MQQLRILVSLAALTATGCTASLPTAPQQLNQEAILPLLQSRMIEFCLSDENSRSCAEPRSGLQAKGLGGVFLPITANIEAVEFGELLAMVDLTVNGIPATCSSGSLDVLENRNTAKIDDVFCNWLGIGNVVAELQFTLDWIGGADTFGGRYSVRFIGTGNGSGNGFYAAQGKTQ